MRVGGDGWSGVNNIITVIPFISKVSFWENIASSIDSFSPISIYVTVLTTIAQ